MARAVAQTQGASAETVRAILLDAIPQLPKSKGCACSRALEGADLSSRAPGGGARADDGRKGESKARAVPTKTMEP
jgi:hypothetical protein